MLMNNETFIKHELEVHFSHYRIYRVLKRGNCSTLYLGEHIHLHNAVAIKVLNPQVASAATVHKFALSARLHANLHHPHIVRVLDYGMRGQLPFLVMDYAPLGTLHDMLPLGRPVALHTILPIIAQIASALQYVHEHQLIHRDIKPQNILLDAQQNVLLNDFGIAMAVQPWSFQSPQESIGTALFAAPEQINGKPLTASDQYALAVMVYSWLCGHPPFMGTSRQLCQQQLYSQPQPLRRYIPTLSPAVEQVVLRALAKDPYQRFADVQAFVYALREALLDHTTDALPAYVDLSRLCIPAQIQ